MILKLVNQCFQVLLKRNCSSSHAERMSKGLPKRLPLPGVKKVLLISSTKGGVGKSSTTVNLAIALSKHSCNPSVGILDADVFGPSIPKMMNLEACDPPLTNNQNLMIPLVNHGIKCMSMGFLVPADQAVVWRGLMVMQGVQRLLRGVLWGPLDYLLIDMPPGTGDVQLSICQNIPVDGALIVTTPNLVSLSDVRKGITMLNKINVNILGIIENMSYFICDSCDKKHFIFGDSENILKIASETNLQVLSRVPYDPRVMQANDEGLPILLEGGDPSPTSKVVADVYNKLATKIVKEYG